LLVDDEPHNLRLLSQVLAKSGYRTRAVDRGEVALEVVRETPPDLILLDIMMPGMDGYEVCERLKADADTRDIPVIFVSALEATDYKVDALERGAVDYITKPIEVREVLARVRTHLSLRDLRRKMARKNARLEREIVERRAVEAELCRYRDRLEARVAARTADLEHEVAERKQAETALAERLRFESLVADLSARFINLPADEVDEAIERGLRQIVAFLDVACSALAGFADGAFAHEAPTDGVTYETAAGEHHVALRVTHSYPVEARQVFRGEDIARRFRWYTATLLGGEVVNVPDPEALPPGAETERAYMREAGVQSHLALPLRVGGEVGYVLSFAAEAPRAWSPALIQRLRLMGELFANVLARQRMEARLQAYTENLEQLVAEKVQTLERARTRMIQTAKLASLGEMATGVAHELNQPLTAMLFEADYLKMVARKLREGATQPLTPEDLQRIGEDLAQDIGRARRITDYLRAFKDLSRGGVVDVDLNETIESSFILIEARLQQHNIVVRRHLAPDLPAIWANSHRLEQVFLNLISNAEYALDEMAERVRAGDVERPDYQKTLEIVTRLEDGWVVAEVRDNGCGIPEEIQDHIFEPFFTTRPEGQGAGLSLSISRDIVREFDGQITFESAENQGTVMTLRFPCHTPG
jgi:C4-dicarboxylate-specific signal transduction histidine kinase